MTVPCKISSAEMRDAFRLNLTPSFWWKAALGNVRVIIYLVILIAAIVAGAKDPNRMPTRSVGVLIALIILFIALYLMRLHRTLEKNAKTLNESCNSLIIDGQGITAEGTNGSKSFTPWSALHRWREGKLVFTIGDAKSFRAVSKATLGEIQSGELRSLLLSQIR